MSLLQALALSSLPIAGQQVLAKNPKWVIRSILAGSPFTCLNIVDALVEDDEAYVRYSAGIRTRNIDALTELLTVHNKASDSVHGPAVILNPRTPVETLVKILESKDTHSAIRGYCHPATPETERRKLTAERANSLVHLAVKGQSEVIARAHQLVLTNPWMLETPTKWDVNIQQGIGNSPDATRETFAALSSTKDAGRYIAENRIKMWEPHRDGDIGSLLALGQIRSDLQAMRQPGFSHADACKIADRQSPRNAASHVMGQLMNRYGAFIIFGSKTTSEVGMDRYDGIGFITKQLSAVDWNFGSLQQDITETIGLLGENREHWETFVSLLDHWHGTVIEAAKTACKL